MKKIIIGIIIGFLLSGITVYAININSKEVSFTPNSENFKVNNVEDAINYLYENSNNTITSGEAFLISIGANGSNLDHNYSSGYSAYLTINNLDFSNIKEFTYTFSLNVNNGSDQMVSLYNDKSTFLKSTSSSSGTVKINGASNVKYIQETSFSGKSVFKISSYTTMDNKVHTFN